MVFLLTSLLFILLTFILALQNFNLVDVKFLFWQFKSPTIVIAVTFFVSGFLFASLVHTFRYLSFEKILKQLGAKMSEMQDEITKKDKQISSVQQDLDSAKDKLKIYERKEKKDG